MRGLRRADTLRTRLLVALALVALLAVVVTSTLVGLLGAHDALGARREALRRQADAAASATVGLRFGPFGGGAGRLRIVGVGLARGPRVLFAVRRALADTPDGSEGTIDVAGQELLYVRRRSEAGPIAAVRPSGRLDGDAGLSGRTVALAALAGLLLAGLVAVPLAGGLGRPLRRLTAAMGPMARGEPFLAPPARGPRELDELEASVAALDRELRRAREAERRFLASVSHELRTPLSALGGWAEALADGHATPAEAAAVVRAEAARLGLLVDDLLALGRAGAGDLAVADDEVDLTAVAREIVARHAQAAAEAGVALSADVGHGPARCRGDHERIVQAASNLVDNAVRVVPRGGTVVVRARPAELAVEDDGPGLAPEDRARAFEPLLLHRRLGPERAGRAGLGLALVAELARAMGGRATSEDRAGGGSRFVLALRPAATG